MAFTANIFLLTLRNGPSIFTRYFCFYFDFAHVPGLTSHRIYACPRYSFYNDYEHSFIDSVSFIADGERYQDAKKVAASPTQFIRALQDAGYATDPKYAEKVIKVMQSISEELKSILPGEDK